MRSGVSPEVSWKPGSPILLQEVRQGRVWSVKPVTVVQDAPDLVALWVVPGTHWLQPQRPGGGPVGVVDVLRDTWVLADAVWQGGGALILQMPTAAHALIGFWDDANQGLESWYLNLQAPLRRTPLGFDTLDHILDIVVSRDRRTWAWKDEEPLAEAVRRGLVSPDAAQAIRGEGERALRLLLTGEPPYAPEWEQWAPDPGWGIPRTCSQMIEDGCHHGAWRSPWGKAHVSWREQDRFTSWTLEWATATCDGSSTDHALSRPDADFLASQRFIAKPACY